MRISREVLSAVLSKQGLCGSKKGEDVYQNLLQLTENDYTGPEIMEILYNVRDRIHPDLDVHRIAMECEIRYFL